MVKKHMMECGFRMWAPGAHLIIAVKQLKHFDLVYRSSTWLEYHFFISTFFITYFVTAPGSNSSCCITQHNAKSWFLLTKVSVKIKIESF